MSACAPPVPASRAADSVAAAIARRSMTRRIEILVIHPFISVSRRCLQVQRLDARNRRGTMVSLVRYCHEPGWRAEREVRHAFSVLDRPAVGADGYVRVSAGRHRKAKRQTGRVTAGDCIVCEKGPL